jgi:metallophosphoesterase (TIGR00282 family)
MRLAFFGDVVGRSGRTALMTHLPGLRRRLRLDFVVADAENIAAGFGVTEALATGLFEAGVDCITLGNHAWDQREALSYIEREPRLLRPLNYPRLSRAPGKGAWVYDVPAGRVLVICALGHRGMDALDDPFSAVDAALEACPLGAGADAILVEMHAEATSEKMAMGHFCDGRTSLVVGAHTHIPTADAQILPGGTAYQTDAGACCDYDSVIGMDKSESVRRFATKLPGERHRPADGPGTVCGVFVETDAGSGLALRVEPIRIGGRLFSHVPEPGR